MFIRAGNAYTWAAFLVVHGITPLGVWPQKDTKEMSPKKQSAVDKPNWLIQNIKLPEVMFRFHHATGLRGATSQLGGRRAHSRFLLPGRAAGRRRFLPDASRLPAASSAEYAGCRAEPSGRPTARREGAGSELSAGPGRRVGGRCSGPPRPLRGFQLCSSSPRTPAKGGVPAPRVRQVQGTLVDPA